MLVKSRVAKVTNDIGIFGQNQQFCLLSSYVPKLGNQSHNVADRLTKMKSETRVSTLFTTSNQVCVGER